ncbi:MAG: C45 family autoproteolytic acyltransferase/hydrolase [bacterium]
MKKCWSKDLLRYMTVLTAAVMLTLSGMTDNTNGLQRAEALCKADKVAASFEQGLLYADGKIKLAEMHGSWRDMGRQYGALLGEDLRFIAHEWFAPYFKEHPEKRAAAERIADDTYNMYPHHLKEMMLGMTETSGMTLEEIKLVNSVERAAGIMGCSGLAVYDDYAKDKLVYGRNYDFFPNYKQLEPTVTVVVYHPADGSLPMANISIAGEIYTVNGLNSRGIFLELNNGSASSAANDKARLDSLTGLSQVLHEAETLDYVDRFFHTWGNNSSFIIGVADSKEARSYEWCTLGLQRGDAVTTKGVMAQSNAFFSPEWQLESPSEEKSFWSEERRNNLLKLAQKNKGKIDAAMMQKLIILPKDKGGAYLPDFALYQLVVEPESKKIWLRLPGVQDWTEIEADGFLQEAD